MDVEISSPNINEGLPGLLRNFIVIKNIEHCLSIEKTQRLYNWNV